MWRRWRYRFCCAVFVLGLVTSTAAIWANVRVQESDAWAEMMGPLADNAAIREYVVDRASVIIDDQIGADENAGRLQRSARSQVAGLAHTLVREFVESDQFSPWWTNANREAHRTLVRLERGEDVTYARIDGDALLLDVQPIVRWLNDKLESYVSFLHYQITVPQDGVYITLYRADALRQIARIAAHLDTLSVVLPVVTLLALVGAMLAASDRRAAAGQIALGTAIGTGLAIAVLYLGLRWLVLGQPEQNQAAVAAFIRIILNDLAFSLRSLTVGSLVLATVLAALRSHIVQDSRLVTHVRSDRGLAAWAKVGAGVLVIALVPDPGSWIAIVAVGLIGWGCFDLVRAQRTSHTASA